jgi:hypothetical protein
VWRSPKIKHSTAEGPNPEPSTPERCKALPGGLWPINPGMKLNEHLIDCCRNRFGMIDPNAL